jgi:trehalose/maltose hydrolase-like predicted phosphorylase
MTWQLDASGHDNVQQRSAIERALEPTPDPAWVLEETRYDPLREIDSESRFAVSNGFLGVRGAREISRGPMWISSLHTFNVASWPRTYVAGLFDTPNIEPPVPVLVPAADWLRVQIRFDGDLLLLRQGELLAHRRILDLRRGVLIVDWQQRTPAGIVTRVRTLRLVSHQDRGIGLQLLELSVEQDAIEVTFDAEFDEVGFGLEVERLGHDLGVWRTEQSRKRIAMAGAAALQVDGAELAPSARGPLRWGWRWRSTRGRVAMFQRMVAVSRSDERRVNGGHAARQILQRAIGAGWNGVLAAHAAAWTERWRCSDVEIDGDASAQQALRFAIYHLNSAANPADEHVSIGARALTGDGYLGHVFWDTDIYLLPFYTFTWPEAARALLMYRYRTLDGARRKAARMGWRGAMYAWESADTGDETTPEQIPGQDGRPVAVLCGTEEQHISADVAYAVWQYWQATGDAAFLRDAGAEILLETGRFWASRAQLELDGRRHIRGVIGPDEYHEHVDDNAFTNCMARWNIRRALEATAMLRYRWPECWLQLSRRLGIDDRELEAWRETAEMLVTGGRSDTGVLEQFAGFFQLEDIAPSGYAGRTASMEAVLGRERVQRSQVSKQADVIALLALLPEEFDAPETLANFRYYEPRCGHDSSLSRPLHALVAARLGDTRRALRYFSESAATDLADPAGASAGGIRIATLGGLWQAVIFGFAGVACQSDALSVNPQLPEAWDQLGFRLYWRGRWLEIRIDQARRTFSATLQTGESMALLLSGQLHELAQGRPIRLILSSRETL